MKGGRYAQKNTLYSYLCSNNNLYNPNVNIIDFDDQDVNNKH